MAGKIMAEDDQARMNLIHAVENSPANISLKSLSIALGRNPAYLHQYLFRNSPRILPEHHRLHLAQLLSINEYLLRPHQDKPPLDGHNIAIFYLDHPSQSDVNTPWFIPQNFLLPHGVSSGEHFRLAVVGDGHLAPQFNSGDIVMVNLIDKNVLTAGFFILDMGDHIRVRHLEQVSPSNSSIIITSCHSSSYESLLDLDTIMGRVVFHTQILHNSV